MMIDRRAFIAGTALLAVAPACGLLPLDAAADVADVRPPVFMIEGWSAQDDSDPGNQVWIKIGHAWPQLGDSWRRRRQAEPALALSMPEKPNDLDDGLLTASEIAQLKLDADWAVLSAYNTAARINLAQKRSQVSLGRSSMQRTIADRQPCLPVSCPGVSATLTTIAFDNSSLRWLEINT
jgi:hypothetical protein